MLKIDLPPSAHSTTILYEGQKIPLFRSEVEISIISILDYFNAFSSFPKFYWKNRDDLLEKLCFGKLLKIDHPPKYLTSGNISFYGAAPYKSKDPIWEDCRDTFFILPEFEIIRREKKFFFAKNYLKKTASLESISLPIDLISSSDKLHIERKKETPSYQDWKKLLEHAFLQPKLKKVVLARKTLFMIKGDTLSILKGMQHHQNSYIFGLFFSSTEAFLGLSPERLYKREKSTIYCEALAGTIKRGKTPKEDIELGQKLLNSKKDLKEFNFVKNYLQEKLLSLYPLTSVTDKISLYKTQSLQHLYYPFKMSGILSDEALITTLHPTPAIAGVPKETALEFIENNEPFDRGLYSAPIGYTSPDIAEIAVAIRSFFIIKNTLHLFAGAGIIKESNSKNEWEELEYKAQSILKGAFGAYQYQ